MEITVLHNQSVLDIAIQHTGSVLNAFSIAAANNMAVSDTLIAGSALLIPETVTNDADIYRLFKDNNLRPATSISDTSVIPSGKGLGWMQIKNNFKVS
ncbi:MAG TPA: hypothetical protein DCQ50_14780 [Chryseobacterium sp.]|nr:hypothetical protein [Chryseobacterium gambrini]HAO08212.1 hypothetical protein [Chryseobacterium sp.]